MEERVIAKIRMPGGHEQPMVVDVTDNILADMLVMGAGYIIELVKCYKCSECEGLNIHALHCTQRKEPDL